MDHFCMVCGTKRPEDFTDHDYSLLCDDCYDVFNYWYKEALQDMKTTYRAKNGSEMFEAEFIQGLEEFADIKGTEYNAALARERRERDRIRKAKAHGVGTSP